MAVDPCDLPAAWFDQPTLPKYTSIPPNHSANPSDCPFYAPSWQQFLFATNPLPKSHLPAFLGYADFQQVFSPNQGVGPKDDSEKSMMLSLEPRDIERANQPSAAHQKLLDESAALNGSPPRRASLDDTLQAAHGRSVGGTLIDQQGHFIYYAIHANPAMVRFLNANHLTGPDVADHIRSAQPFATMAAPTTPQESLAEYKSAWMIVKDRDSAPTYFVTRARVPRYVVQADGKLVPKLGCLPPHRRETREVWVALLALHVVFTLPGHPEMIWSTFEHVSDTPDGKLVRDNAPAANTNSGDATTAIISELVPKYPLFKSGTPATQGNTPLIKPTDAALLASHWDKRGQAFTKNGLLQTSIFRVFPGSKMSGTDSSEDSDVVTVNANATARFNDQNIVKAQADKRSNYRLVGAIYGWTNPTSSPLIWISRISRRKLPTILWR
ncbi:MAG: hypothetical protein ABI197_12330 [Granulicella sp.]